MQHYMEIPIGSQKIVASLHMPDPEPMSSPVPVVICCHGLTGTKIGTCYRFVTLARRLAEENIACLRFDFRGCGESDGEFCDLTPQHLQEDLLAVISALDRLPGCDATRLGIIASSFGGFTTSLAASSLPHLRGLVFWAPVANVLDLVEREMTEEGRAFLQQQGWLDHRGLRLGRMFFDQIPRIDAPALLANTPTPLLVFHSREDSTVPFQHGQAYVDAMAKTGQITQLLTLPGDDHGMRSVEANDRIIRDTVEWLIRFLQPASADAKTE